MFGDEFLYPKLTSIYSAKVNIVLTVFIMLISIPGNCLTAIVILRTEQLRKEASYLLLFSKCIADILVSVLAQPLFIASMIVGTHRSTYLDNLLFTFSWGMAMSSALGIITITIDRFVYISYPLHYRLYMTKSKAKTMIVLVWTTSFLFGLIPLFWYNELILHSSTLTVLLSVSGILLFTYCHISCKIYTGVNINPPVLPQNSDSRQKQKNQTQTTRTALLIVLSFFVCWYPWVILSFVKAVYNATGSYHSGDSYIVILYWLFLVFGHGSSACNVFIYIQKDKVLRTRIEKYIPKISLPIRRQPERNIFPSVRSNANIEAPENRKLSTDLSHSTV